MFREREKKFLSGIKNVNSRLPGDLLGKLELLKKEKELLSPAPVQSTPDKIINPNVLNENRFKEQALDSPINQVDKEFDNNSPLFASFFAILII